MSGDNALSDAIDWIEDDKPDVAAALALIDIADTLRGVLRIMGDPLAVQAWVHGVSPS